MNMAHISAWGRTGDSIGAGPSEASQWLGWLAGHGAPAGSDPPRARASAQCDVWHESEHHKADRTTNTLVVGAVCRSSGQQS